MKKLNRFVCLLVVLGLLCGLSASILLFRRIQAENERKTVCPVMSAQEISELAQASGQRQADWYQALKQAGLLGVLLTPEQLEKDAELCRSISEAGLAVIQVGGVPQTDVYCFALRYDISPQSKANSGILTIEESLPIDRITQSLQDRLLVIFENEPQTGLCLPENWDVSVYCGKIAKGFWLNRFCQASVGKLGYSGTEETENILFRAVIDRGLQVLWISPVSTEDGKMVTELSTYVQLLSRLESRLDRAGYSYGIPEGYDPTEQSALLLFLAGLAVLLSCVLLVTLLVPMQSWTIVLLSIFCLAENAAALMLYRELQITLLALLASICYPCLSVVMLGKYMEQAEPYSSACLRMLSGVPSCVAVALLGGVMIGALQSSREYLIVLQLFRGVKLSQLAVFSFAFLYFFRKLFHHPGNKLLDDWKELRTEFRSPLLLLVPIVLVLAAGLVFLLRTGDRMIGVSVQEQRLRNALEHFLIYRPRTKEFLLGWPFLCLSLFFTAKNRRILRWFCAVFAAVGFASVTNTFCHSRAHFLVSLFRTGIGLVIGVILGGLLIAGFKLIQRKQRRKE